MRLFKPNIEKMKKKNDVASLIKVLENEGDLRIRQDAVVALGEIGNASTVQPLYDYLAECKELVSMRELIIDALGKLGMDAVEPLCSAIAHDKKYDVHMSFRVREVFVKIGVPAVKPLCVALKNSNLSVRKAAVCALGTIGDISAVEPLVNFLDDKEIGELVVPWLAKIGVPAIEPLSEFFKECDNPSIRNNIIRAVGNITENKQALNLMCLAIKDNDNKVREKAAEALGKIGGKKAVESLIIALRDSNCEVRFAAAESLEEIGLPLDLDPITNAVFLISKQDWDGAVLLGDVAVEPLCALLVDDEFKEKKLREYTQEKHGYDMIPFYMQLERKMPIQNEDRIMIIRVLGQIGNTRAIESLCCALKDTDESVRDNAAEALRKIGEANSAESITLALRNIQDDENRNLAADFLKTI